MNLLASYDWLGEYVSLKETPEPFAARVSLCGPGVERLYPQGENFKNIVLGHVLEVKPHPNADKLRLAVTDVGGKKLTIVCGGSNLKTDQWVAVALVDARVRWHGEGEPIGLKPTEIRGVKSDGMICAANEIGLFDVFPHAEREILDLGAALPEAELEAGANLADVLGLSDDVVLDVEVTTNRPDAMSLVGLAREAAAILRHPFIWKPAPRIKAGKAKLDVAVRDKKLCPRYLAVKLDGVKVRPSPWWLKRRLMSAGVRPINNVVDVTNFVMLELGQPLHAFDADKLSGGISVRRAKKGESLAALDGKTYEFDDSVLVIADAEKPVAVAGIMGGEGSSVTPDTTSVVFEAATFDPVSVRRTARKLNLYSDAQLRFEKGLSTEAPPDALNRVVELCLELAGGFVASAVADARAGTYRPRSVSITTDEINALIGVDLPAKDMKDTLERLGFKLKVVGRKLTAVVPSWRGHDVESGRDLVEEIARIYGYGNIPPVFPVGLAPRPMDRELVWEDRLKTVAKGAGLTETYSYSFVSKELMAKAGYDVAPMLRVQNPLTDEFAYLRTTLLPSLLQTVQDNQERFREQTLFEIAHVYYPRPSISSRRSDEIASPSLAMTKWKQLPDEQLELGAAFLGGDDVWKKAKGFVEHVLCELGVETTKVTWKKLTGDPFWHPGRSVQAFVGGTLLGTLGEVHPTIAARFKLEGRLAMVDLPLEDVFREARTTMRYAPLPIFPEAKRDIALVVGRDAEAEAIIRAMKTATTLLTDVQWFDTYRGKGLPEGKKSVAFHLTFSAPDRTLETKEVDEAMAGIGVVLEETFDAEIRR